MRSSITICLMPELKGGPFVFWNGLEDGIQHAAELGFDAVEIFPASAAAMDEKKIDDLLKSHDLKLSTVGSGGGWVLHKLSLTSPDAEIRKKSEAFIKGIIEKAATLGASTIVGSMQGKWGEGVSRDTALDYLGDSLARLGDYAITQGKPLLYEPLNRYETNLLNKLSQTIAFLETRDALNVKILADLFHMNIEETTIHGALRDAGKWVGHVHFADSNRRAAGLGHMDYMPIVSALNEIGYSGYLAAEIFPYPDSREAASRTISAFKRYVTKTGE